MAKDTTTFVIGALLGAVGLHFWRRRQKAVLPAPGDDAASPVTKEGVATSLRRALDDGTIDPVMYGAATDMLETPGVRPSVVQTFVQQRVSAPAPPPPAPEAVQVTVPGTTIMQPPPPPPPPGPECMTNMDCIVKYGPDHICVEGKCVGAPKPPPNGDPDIIFDAATGLYIDAATGIPVQRAPDPTVMENGLPPGEHVTDTATLPPTEFTVNPDPSLPQNGVDTISPQADISVQTLEPSYEKTSSDLFTQDMGSDLVTGMRGCC
jgi:hypothetical protein